MPQSPVKVRLRMSGAPSGLEKNMGGSADPGLTPLGSDSFGPSGLVSRYHSRGSAVANATKLLQSAAMPSQDESWMERTLAEAKAAEEAGEVPVGAVIVKDGVLIASGQNRNLRDHDPSAHAEIVALRAAGNVLGNHRLEGCEMYVIIEPCAMCAGALVHARVARLVYGAKDPKAGAVESVMNVVNHPRLNHKMEVVGGVLEAECSQLLRNFFRARRLGSE